MFGSTIADGTRLNAKSKVFPVAMRTYASACYARIHNGLMLTGWVILGLGLISLLVEILARFPDWFGPIFFGPKVDTILVNRAVTAPPVAGVAGKAVLMISISNAGDLFSVLIPVIITIVLYMGIMLIQPRLFPWP